MNHTDEILYRCKVCQDQGLQQLTAGTWDVAHGGPPIMLEATPEQPIYKQCRGPMATGCPYQTWRAGEAAKKKGQRGASAL